MSALRPRAGVHYPRSAGEFRSWFATDADCLDYLDWLRWPEGFVCPRCGRPGGWLVADGRLTDHGERPDLRRSGQLNTPVSAFV